MPPSVAHSFLRVRKNEEFSSKLKCKTHGVHVPVQVARVYIHNTPEGTEYLLPLPVCPTWFPVSSIDLDSGSANDKRLHATGREIGRR